MGGLRAFAGKGETETGAVWEVVKGLPAFLSHLVGPGVTEKGTILKEKLKAQL